MWCIYRPLKQIDLRVKRPDKNTGQLKAPSDGLLTTENWLAPRYTDCTRIVNVSFTAIGRKRKTICNPKKCKTEMEVQFRCFAAKKSENKICVSFSYAIENRLALR